MANRKKTKKKVTKKVIKKNKKILEDLKKNNLQILEVEIGGNKIKLNVYEEIRLAVPDNPGEVIEKMNESPSNYWWLGSMKAELQKEIDDLELEFHLWLEKRKANYDGDKAYNSENAKERQVLVKYPKSYREYKQRINEKKYVLKKVDVARRAYESHISLLQSIGSMLRSEKQTTRIPEGDIEVDDLDEL